MKKLKIGFTDTHDHLAGFFHHVLSARYDIEINNTNPDFLFFGDKNFGTDNLNFSKNDCTKIFFTGENQRPDDYDCHYAITFDHNYNPWHYRLPLFVIYMWALKHVHNTSYDRNYILNPEVKDKTGFATFVVQNPRCEERNNFFQKLNSIERVDSGGPLYNNINAKLDGEAAKIDFLSTRKFNICFESMSYPGYVTEKILHAFYAGTIPIYWGSPTIEHDFNPKSFINVHNFKSQEYAMEYVLKVDEDDELYDAIVRQPKFVGNVPPSYIFYNNFLNWFDAVVYQKILSR